MTNEDVFECWAPDEARWTAWAKPVLFASMKAHHRALAERSLGASGGGRPSAEVARPLDPPPWAPREGERVALVVDLPGEQSVAAGVGLARAGYRPVPLFNACVGPSPLIDVEPLLEGLARGAVELRSIEIPGDAPPAFLLDANRMRPAVAKIPGKFDNRWVVFPQDFPSASLLHSLDIRGTVVVQQGTRVQDDLAHVLRRWQEGGISIALQQPGERPPARAIVVPKPSRFRMAWYRALVLLGLRRNAAGGFGAVIPEPSSHTGIG